MWQKKKVQGWEEVGSKMERSCLIVWWQAGKQRTARISINVRGSLESETKVLTNVFGLDLISDFTTNIKSLSTLMNNDQQTFYDRSLIIMQSSWWNIPLFVIIYFISDGSYHHSYCNDYSVIWEFLNLKIYVQHRAWKRKLTQVVMVLLDLLTINSLHTKTAATNLSWLCWGWILYSGKVLLQLYTL